MILETLTDREEMFAEVMQFPILASIVLILSMALVGFAIKKIIQLMVK